MPDVELHLLELHLLKEAHELLAESGVPYTAIHAVAVGEEPYRGFTSTWVVLKQTPAAGGTWQPGSEVRLSIIERDEFEG